ncbi:hypothetical protein J7L67_05410 [bacterium]|nr:hypothetical protein [bacterium]
MDTHINVIGLGSLLVAIFMFMWKSNSNVTSNVDKKLTERSKENDEKYVSKDVCKVIHANTDKNFDRIEKRVDNGFREVNKKMDEILKLVKQK